MKKPLILEELTVEQKIGQLLVARGFLDDEDRAFVYEMIKKRAVGGVQVTYYEGCEKDIAEMKAIADYPIQICADMETGFPGSPYRIPSMLALAATNNPDLAYEIASVIAIEAKRCGHNTVWSPNVDMVTKGALCRVSRVFGNDPEYVGKMSNAIMKGFVDNGMFATAKHWPGGRDITQDTHMASAESELLEKDILDVDFIPYKRIMEGAGLPGVMTKHVTYKHIDPDYPATMSKKVIGILRNQGFDGLIATDSFAMMAILNKYSEKDCYGIAIDAGNDMILPNYRVPFKTSYNYLLDCYKRGMFSEERLNEAVRRVITSQNMTMKEPTREYPSEYQIECYERVAKESICAICDDNVKAELDKDTKKLFIVLKGNLYKDEIGDSKEITDGSFINEGNLDKVREIISAKFPGSDIYEICEYPNSAQVENACFKSTKADEVIFLTYVASGSYKASEALTEKVINIMKAMDKKLAAVVHMGNPFTLEDIPHTPRIIAAFGGGLKTIETTMEILKGEYEAKGTMPIKLDLK